MTAGELRVWRLGRFRPGTRDPLTQADLGRMMCLKGGCKTVQRWEFDPDNAQSRKVPTWLPTFLRLVDSYNGNKREITHRTMRFLSEEVE
jgi:hypothetical protein